MDLQADLKVSGSRLDFLPTYVHSLNKAVLGFFTLVIDKGNVFEDAIMFRSRTGSVILILRGLFEMFSSHLIYNVLKSNVFYQLFPLPILPKVPEISYIDLVSSIWIKV